MREWEGPKMLGCCKKRKLRLLISVLGFPASSDGKESACNAGDLGLIPEFNPWTRKIPLEEGVATHSNILARRIHGQRSLAGYSPWGRKESDTTERPTYLCLTIATSHQQQEWYKKGRIREEKVGSEARQSKRPERLAEAGALRAVLGAFESPDTGDAWSW